MFFIYFIFFLGSFNKKNMSSEEILTNFDQDVELIENCSLPQLVKQDLQRFILGGNSLKKTGSQSPFLARWSGRHSITF